MLVYSETARVKVDNQTVEKMSKDVLSSRDSTYLQLSKGETTSSTDSSVVLDGRASDHGS